MLKNIPKLAGACALKAEGAHPGSALVPEDWSLCPHQEVAHSREPCGQAYLGSFTMILLKGDPLFGTYSNTSLFQHQLFGSHPMNVRLCSVFLVGQAWKGQWEFGLGDPAGEPKRILGHLGVLQGQLQCHIEGVSVPVRYLPDKLHPPLSLEQCYGTEAMQAAQLRAFPARTPHYQDAQNGLAAQTPAELRLSPREVWRHSNPVLTSLCTQT